MENVPTVDAVIAQLQTVSTTQVYATVIAVSLAFAFFLLNSGGGSSALAIKTEESSDVLHKPKAPMMRQQQQQQQQPMASIPEPKWHILKITNYVTATGFLLSVLQFASNASTYLNDSTSLLQFLSVWSVFLCYFFGFFGISFIELDDFADQQLSSQHQQPAGFQMTLRKSHKADRYVFPTILEIFADVAVLKASIPFSWMIHLVPSLLLKWLMFSPPRPLHRSALTPLRSRNRLRVSRLI